MTFSASSMGEHGAQVAASVFDSLASVVQFGGREDSFDSATCSNSADEWRFVDGQALLHPRQSGHNRFGRLHAAGVSTGEYERRNMRSHESVPLDLTQPDVLVSRQNDPRLSAGDGEPLDVTDVVTKPFLVANHGQAT
jgi:hypothetical protein